MAGKSVYGFSRRRHARNAIRASRIVLGSGHNTQGAQSKYPLGGSGGRMPPFVVFRYVCENGQNVEYWSEISGGVYSDWKKTSDETPPGYVPDPEAE